MPWHGPPPLPVAQLAPLLSCLENHQPPDITRSSRACSFGVAIPRLSKDGLKFHMGKG